MTTKDEIERLKTQRSRFIAFAFAGNDVLIELDADQVICYCAGTVEPVMGCDPEALKRVPITDLIAERDASAFNEMMLRLRRTGRLDHIPLHFNTPGGTERRLTLSAIRLPETPESTYLALSLLRGRDAREPEEDINKLVSAQEFAAHVSEQILSGTAEDSRLTLLDLTPEKLAEHLSAEKAEQFMGSVLAYLRAWSVGGNGVRRLADGSVGVLHDGALSSDEISQKLNEMLAVFDPEAEPLDVRLATVAIDAADLSEDDLTKALVYTINAFAKSGGDLELESLSAGYERAMEETLGKVATFRRAVGSDNLMLVFQPIVDMACWQVHHYEALARINNGERLIPPARLIGFAEEFGVVEELDMAVMKKAFSLLTDNIGIRPGARVAVNLSGRSVQSDALVADLLRLMHRHQHLLPRLLFEITESHEMTDLARASQVIRKFRTMGCEVCIDDFGAGAAAFPYLKALDVDFLKIDGSYIRDAFHTRHGRPFLRAISGLARDLSIQCIGEMVEDADTMWLLRELGVGYGQGWFFGKPQPDVSRFNLGCPPGRYSQRVVNAL